MPISLKSLLAISSHIIFDPPLELGLSSSGYSMLHAYVQTFLVKVSLIFGIYFLMTLLTSIHIIVLSIASNVLIFCITLVFAIDFFSVIFTQVFIHVHCIFGQL